MKRIFIRNRAAVEALYQDKKIISVIGIGRGVGTTTVATTLAFCFAQKGKSVTFLEGTIPAMTDNLLYAGVAMEQRFANRKFTDFYLDVSKEDSIKGEKNIEEGINWMIVTVDDCKQDIRLKKDEMNRLLLNARGESVILDVTYNTGWESVLLDSDEILAVIDPLPGKLVRNVKVYKEIRKLEARGQKVYWVVNKMNKGVSKHQLKEYIKSNNIWWIDTVPSEKMYSEEYRCQFHWKNEEIYSKILDIFTKISQ